MPDSAIPPAPAGPAATGAAAPPTLAWTAPIAGRPVRATVRLPGSKSMTARAMVLSALATGASTMRYPLKARDTHLMAAGLRALGTQVSTVDDDRWVITPEPLRGPARVDVGLAGTVMRFLPPLAALAEGDTTFDGDEYMRKRPLTPLLGALTDLGVRLTSSSGGCLPLTIHGTGRVRGGGVTIDSSSSSQFVSALLLAGSAFDQGILINHVGPPVPSAPHLRMTVEMVRAAGGIVDDSVPGVWRVEPGRLVGQIWSIEPDLSGAAPFLAAAMVTGGEVTIPDWPATTTQPGDQLRELLTAMGATVSLSTAGLTVRGGGTIRGIEANLSDVSELTMVLAALATLGDRPSRFRGVAHIRGHETDRLAALARELGRLGAEIVEWEDGLEIRPRPLRGTAFETYADHRMAHAAAVIGLAVPGVVLSDVNCTSKTMPEFASVWTGMVTAADETATNGTQTFGTV